MCTCVNHDGTNHNSRAVASLGWVTPGAATEGITPPEKPGDLFSRQFCGVTTVNLLLGIMTTFFSHHCHYHHHVLLLSLGCHPLEGVTPHLFYLSDFVSLLFFVNLPTKFFSFGCHPLEGVTRASYAVYVCSSSTPSFPVRHVPVCHFPLLQIPVTQLT